MSHFGHPYPDVVIFAVSSALPAGNVVNMWVLKRFGAETDKRFSKVSIQRIVGKRVKDNKNCGYSLEIVCRISSLSMEGCTPVQPKRVGITGGRSGEHCCPYNTPIANKLVSLNSYFWKVIC